jgi:hypothetical protein
MNVEHIDTTGSIDYVIIYILAMLQWAKVSFATVLSTFNCYFASDDGNASIIVRIVENWYSFIIIHVILDFLTFYYKSDSICKAFTNI